MKHHNPKEAARELTSTSPNLQPIARIQDAGRGSAATVNVRIALPDATTVKVRFTCPVANVDNVVGQLRQILENRTDLTQCGSTRGAASSCPTAPRPTISTPLKEGEDA